MDPQPAQTFAHAATHFSLFSRNRRFLEWLLLAAFCAFFFFWQLSSFGLIGADEPRYAQVAREMLERHDWITPTLSGAPWLEKPPLYYWQAIIAYRIFGVSDWAARLPSAFDATLLVFAAYFFLRRLRPGFALDGGLIMASCVGIVGFARAASTDMPLAATFTVAMLGWWVWFESGCRDWLLVSYGFLALAMLAKGPVALFFAAVIILIFALTQRSWRIITGSLWPPAVVLFFIIGLPWYVLVQLMNPQFFRIFILEHNLARFGTNMFHHPEPFWYYVPVSLLAWMPWVVFVVAAIALVIRRLRSPNSDSLNLFLMIWLLVVIALFSASSSKLPGYILPAIPAGVLVLANYLRENFAHKPHPTLVVLHALTASALIFGALMCRYTILQHKFVFDSTATVPLIVSFVIAAIIAIAFFAKGFFALRLVALIPAVLALTIALRFGAPVLNQMLSARAVSDSLKQVSKQNLPVAAFLVSRETEFGLQFYRNQKIARYEEGNIPPGEHLVVVPEQYWKGVAKRASGRKITFLGSLPDQNLDFFYVGPG